MSRRRQRPNKGYRRKFDSRGSPLEEINTTKAPRMEVDEVGAMASLSEEEEEISEVDEPVEEPHIEIPDDVPDWVQAFMMRFDNRFDRLDRMESRLVKKIDRKCGANKKEIKKNADSIEDMKLEISGMRNDMKKLQVAQKGVERKVLVHEQRALKDTLVFDGIPEDEGESTQDIIDKVSEKIATSTGHQLLDNSVVKCYRVGRITKPEDRDPAATPRPRSVLLKFAQMRERENVWGDRLKYKNTNVYLNEQFPREIENRRRELYPILRIIKKMDKYKKGSYLIGDRLMVNGRGYTSETLNTLPEDIDIQPLYTKLENGITFFFRWRSPLSNHHPAQFTLGK